MISEFKIELIQKYLKTLSLVLLKEWKEEYSNIHYIYDCSNILEYCSIYCEYNVELFPGDIIKVCVDDIKTKEMEVMYEAKVLEIKYIGVDHL